MGGIPGLLRPNTGRLIASKTWQDQALCRGLPTELFELQDQDPAGEESHELIAQGLRVCSSCPVRAACLGDASEVDRYWTTRGGQPPEGLFEDAEMPRIKPPSKPIRVHGIRPVKKLCKRGHEDWMSDGRGKRRCRTCRRLENAKGWSKRKVKLADVRTPPSESSP